MAKKQPYVEIAVSEFARALIKQGIRVEKIVLFGSQAKGNARVDSDIDVLVVSPDFAFMPLYRRYEVLGKALAAVKKPIEALPCTPEEVQVENLSPASFLYSILAREKTVEYRI